LGMPYEFIKIFFLYSITGDVAEYATHTFLPINQDLKKLVMT
jgi:hypothetical protein